MPRPRARSEADELACLLAESRTKLGQAGRALHDDIGPLLAGAGMWLSTAGDDPAVREALGALDQAMERVRALSQELNPSPVDRMGFRNALAQIPNIDLHYNVNAKLSRESAALLYDATAAAVRAAVAAEAAKIVVKVSGDAKVQVRVMDDGRKLGRKRTLALMTKLAAAAGAKVTVTTNKSTIVSIAYAV